MKWALSYEPYGEGLKGPINGLADEALAKKLRNYKRQVAKRYRVVEPEQIERLLSGRHFISTKLDGELWFLVKREGEVALCSFNGRVLRNTALVRDAEQRLDGVGDVVLAGELIATPPDATRSRVYHVASALGDPHLERTLTFAAFDVVEEGDQDALLVDYSERLGRLRALLDGGERVRVVDTTEGEPSDVARLYREWVVSDRYEGLVVRSERGLTYKIKSTLTFDAVILAYGERITGDVHQVREMSVGLLREDGTYQLVGAVGNGFSEQDRAAWHSRLSKLEVPSRFRLANREGTLSKFVRPEIVVEIRCSDLMTTDSWDAPIRRMSLRYDPSAGYEPVSETPTAVMIHPIFLRDRPDKVVDLGSAGMTQITAYTPLGVEDDAATPAASQPATITRRGAFMKETKGKAAVRKYVVVETHKGAEGSYPAFVSYFTDYSPGRKEPLQTALRSASSLERAEAQVREWLAENVKRGWTEVAASRVGPVLLDPGASEPTTEASAAPRRSRSTKSASSAEAATSSDESEPRKRRRSAKAAESLDESSASPPSEAQTAKRAPRTRKKPAAESHD